MTMIKNTVAILTVAALGAAYGVLPVRSSDDAAKILSERKGASFFVGTKKATAFYQNELGACKVTVMVSDTYTEQLPYNLASVRFNANVAAGTTAEVSTSDGATLALTCTDGAKSLTVETLDQVAYVPARVTN